MIAYISPRETTTWSPAFKSFKYHCIRMDTGAKRSDTVSCLNRQVFLEVLNDWNSSPLYKYWQDHHQKEGE